MKITRVKGHALQCEGGPFGLPGEGHIAWPLDNGQRFSRLSWRSFGDGFALCECGAHSDVLPSGYARKQWHREHKATLTGSEEER